MRNYDFHQVFETKEFEKFACAMLSVREGVTFKRFGEGRDGGTDGLYCDDGGTIILQAKRLGATGKRLISQLRPEVEKAKHLKPERYILVLSGNVGPEIEKQILEMFDGCIRDIQDIVTGDDLNGYLERPEYHSMELAFQKLWISSSVVLDELLKKNVNHGNYQRMKRYTERIRQASKLFVETACFRTAVDILSKRRKIILSGEPGVGKTIHAYCLAKYFMTWQEYEQIWVVDSIQSIYDLMEDDKKQIFIVDDFWGKTQFSEARVGMNPEKKLSELFEDVEWQKNLMVIITTREFVLQQGLRVFSEVSELCDGEKLIVDMKKYTAEQKVRILFKHLYASELEHPYVERIYRKCDSFIKYSHYTPRAVEYYLEHVPSQEKTPEEYGEGLIKYMEKPNDFLEKILHNLTSGARLLCMILFLSEEEMLVKELKQSFLSCVRYDKRYELEPERFDALLKETEGMFTRVSYDEEVGYVIDFINHSLRDFFHEYLQEQIGVYEETLCRGLLFYNQLYVMIEGGLPLSGACRNNALRRLCEEMDELKYTYIYNDDIDYGEYTVNAPPNAYQLHKVWQLMLLYRKSREETIGNFLERYVAHICNLLEQGVRPYEYHEMVNLPELLVSIARAGIMVSVESVIEGYYPRIRWVQEYFYMDMAFLKGFKKEYEPFRKKHWKEMQKRIQGLVFEDVEYLMDGDDCELDFYLELLPEIFQYFGVKYTERFAEKVWTAADRTYQVKEKQTPVEDAWYANSLSKYTVEEEQYEMVVEEAGGWLLGIPNYLSEEELYRELTGWVFSGDEKKCTNCMTEGHFLLRENFCIEDMECLAEYLLAVEALPTSIEEFYEAFCKYIEEKSSLPDIRGEIVRLALGMYEHGLDTLSANGSAIRDIMPNEKYRDKLLEELEYIHILRKQGKWISFLNDNMFGYYLALGILKKDERKRKLFYKERLLNLLYETRMVADILIPILKNADEACCKKYFIKPYMEEFLQKVGNGTDKYIVEQVISLIDMTVDIEEGEPVGASYTSVPALEILETYSGELVYRVNDILERLAVKLSEKIYQFCPDKKGRYKVPLSAACTQKYWYQVLCESGSQKNILELVEYIRTENK